MLLSLWTGFAEDWELQHRVTFDGINRLIIISENAPEVSVKTDVYSDWKEWASLRDNAKFLPAMRVSGGDPVGSGAYTGDIYFLVNDWKILVDHSCVIDGVIYSDDFPSPFIQSDGTNIVTNKVSTLVSVVAPIVEVGGITIPSTTDITNHIDANSIKLSQIKSLIESMNIPTVTDTADAVWAKPTSSMTDTTTIGGYVSKVLLSIPKFLGLK
jgi:hypothetical protein